MAMDNLERLILSPLSPKFWDYRCAPPQPTNTHYFLSSRQAGLQKCHADRAILCSIICKIKTWIFTKSLVTGIGKINGSKSIKRLVIGQ